MPRRWTKKDGTVSVYKYTHKPVPEWMRFDRNKVFDAEEQNRLMLNLGHVTVADLATLMGCGTERIYAWAKHKGIATSTNGIRPRRKPVKRDDVGRMMDLAERLRA